MTGVGQGYEVPEDPELILHGGGNLDEQVDTLVALIVGE
jgi:adenylylsulfate kinase-like enzyme